MSEGKDGLPPGWAMTDFGNLLADSQNGCSARRGSGQPTVVLRLADVSSATGDVARNGLREVPLRETDRDKYALAGGDLLAFRVNGSRDIAGRVIEYRGPDGFAYCDHFIRLRVRAEAVTPSYASLAFASPGVRAQIEQKMVSTAGQNTISQATLRAVRLLLPPLAEQHRIVAKLDALQARADAAREALDAIPPLLDKLRQSVLAAAFRGDLTKAWREQHPDVEPASRLLERIRTERRRRWEEANPGKRYKEPHPVDATGLPELPKGWCWASLGELADVKGGLTKGKRRRAGDALREVPYLRVANVQRGFIDLTDVRTIVATDTEVAELRLHRGDVLFNEGGDRDKLGRGWVWEGQIELCIHQNHVFRARLVDGDVVPRYVSHYGNSQTAQAYFLKTGKQTTNLASINMTQLKALPIPLAPAGEQRQLERLVEGILGEADETQRALATKAELLGRLIRSILAKAFRGELVPQDPREEPAARLLDSIAEARAKAKVPTSALATALRSIEGATSQPPAARPPGRGNGSE